VLNALAAIRHCAPSLISGVILEKRWHCAPKTLELSCRRHREKLESRFRLGMNDLDILLCDVNLLTSIHQMSSILIEAKLWNMAAALALNRKNKSSGKTYIPIGQSLHTHSREYRSSP
jgi:hypothetical protein